MESAKESTKISCQGFIITIVKLADQKLSVHVLNRATGEAFEDKSLVLNRLNYQAVVEALKGEKKEFKVKMEDIDCDGCRVLEIQVTFEHPLLPTIRECLPCKKVKDLSDVEMLKNSVVEYPSKFARIRQQLAGMKTKRYIDVQKDTRECRSSTDQPIVSLILPRGKYLLTISLMVKVSNQWVYVNLDRNKAKLIDQQGYYLPNEASGNFCPSILRTIYDVTEDDHKVQFCIGYGNSYAATITNAIMTAELISYE